jgi:hypothetical protein
MSVELVNGFILLPHAPDWNVKPQFRRDWRTGITDAVTGAEDRLSFRHLPLRGVEFQVTPFTPEEHRRLTARILAARKSGWVAVPLWGRGAALASPASGDAVTLASETAWLWAADDYVFFSNLEPEDPNTYEVRQVESVAGVTLTLDQALARTYRRFCWPVLFGRFQCDDLRILTSHHGSVRVSVLERDVRPESSDDLCEIILLVEGGGDNFDCYTEQDPVETILNAGNYWGGPWHGQINFAGIQARERFEGYVLGPIGILNKEYGWAGPASVLQNLAGRISEEFFDYEDTEDMGDGSGWAGAGDIFTNI